MEHSKDAYVATREQPESPPPVYHKPSLWARFEDFLNTFWIIEIVACFISLSTILAIFAVAKYDDGWLVSERKHFGYSWTLNSLAGLLATISEIAMAVPLASCISQLKWTWWVIISLETIPHFETPTLPLGNLSK